MKNIRLDHFAVSFRTVQILFLSTWLTFITCMTKKDRSYQVKDYRGLIIWLPCTDSLSRFSVRLKLVYYILK